MGVTTALKKSGHDETGHTVHTNVYFHNTLPKMLVKYLTVMDQFDNLVPNRSPIRNFALKKSQNGRQQDKICIKVNFSGEKSVLWIRNGPEMDRKWTRSISNGLNWTGNGQLNISLLIDKSF